MAHYVDDWKKAKASAEKLIGKQGKLPKPRADVLAAMEAAGKPYQKLLSQRDAMEGTILEFRDAVAKVGDAAESYGDIIDASDFGLDDGDKDQAKQIKDAQKTLTDALGSILDYTKKLSSNFEGFNKSLAEMEKLLKSADSIVAGH